MKRAIVTGASGFIGHHLCRYLKERGYWVYGMDIRPLPEEWAGPWPYDGFGTVDLRRSFNLPIQCDELYALAADMGGAGYVCTGQNDAQIMRNNALINAQTIRAAAEAGVPRYFFSSSVCVYRDMQPDEPELTEDGAYPANPHNEYGWEKLYAERMALAYARHSDMEVRIARFQNTYGPECAWRGGREKAPAAICRKVAEAEHGGSIQVWGDGTAIRSYTYIDDLLEGIYLLMHSDLEGPVNIGSSQRVSVSEMVATTLLVADKWLDIEYVEGPVGVQARNFSKARIHSLGWEAKTSFKEGIALTYPWIEVQVASSLARGIE